MRMDTKLIINADDFGLASGVNRAVRKAHTEGILTSATLMANAPEAEEAVKIAAELPGLGVGIHINLLENKPLCSVPAVDRLTGEDGNFACSAGKIAMMSVFSPKAKKAMEAEMRSQIEWLLDMGIHPTHLDSHKHLHCFPPIFSIVEKLAYEYHIPALRLVREPVRFSRNGYPPTSSKDRRRAFILRMLSGFNLMRGRRLFKTRGLIGINHTGKVNTAFLHSLISDPPDGVYELMTHPGFTDGLEAGRTRLLEQRKIELDALCDDNIKQEINKAGIKLIHYGML